MCFGAETVDIDTVPMDATSLNGDARRTIVEHPALHFEVWQGRLSSRHHAGRSRAQFRVFQTETLVQLLGYEL
jgi:hypothetical protein